MKNKTIGNILLWTVALVLLTAIFETSLDYSTSDNLYGLAGISFFIFGVWGGLRLKNTGE